MSSAYCSLQASELLGTQDIQHYPRRLNGFTCATIFYPTSVELELHFCRHRSRYSAPQYRYMLWLAADTLQV